MTFRPPLTVPPPVCYDCTGAYMRVLVLLCLTIAAFAETYPASAHEAFKARAAWEAEHHRVIANAQPGSAVQPSAEEDALSREADHLQYLAVIDWFSDVSHDADVTGQAPQLYRYNLAMATMRSRIAQHIKPLADPEHNRSDMQMMQDIGNGVPHANAPDWLDDLVDGAHKGTHRTR